MKSKFKPFHVFAEIKRINEEARTVDAYAFVNEVVEGEGGIRLKRSAMEAATPDYMDWANVRRMHTPDAVGTAESVVWDATGAAMVVRVVDDDAWKKVQAGVYKGLSVGVAATVMRGKDVEACRWFETSLVDRPKDPDAKILAFRVEGVQPGEEFEAEVEEETPVRRSFDDYIEAIEEEDLRQDLYSAWSWFMDCCYGCMDDPAALQLNLDQFAAYCKTIIGGEAAEARGAIEKAIARIKVPAAGIISLPAGLTEKQFADFQAGWREVVARAEPGMILQPYPDLLERAQTAETELARVQGALSESETALATAKEQVTRLEKMPVGRPGPIRYPAALARTFTANEVDGVDPAEVIALQTEYTALMTDTPKEPDEKKRSAAAARVMAIETRLRELGAG